MDKTKDGGPAFPRFRTDAWGRPIVEPGMSLRDYFAGQAIGLVDLNYAARFAEADSPEWRRHFDQAAKVAYAVADALLKARGSDT